LRKVTYSTFTDWTQITRWYAGLTERKKDFTLELAALADSLTPHGTEKAECVRRIHHFITQNIRYSYVAFRQSGWIPQRAHDVLATRIGDCKDMASLGVSLLQRAGIPASLVLVNTQRYGFTGHAYVGPDFDHCIATYELDGKRYFVDFTDPGGTCRTLPVADQDAMALIIAAGQNTPIRLPLDSAAQRQRMREVRALLDDNGDLNEQVHTLRTGVNATSFRDHFRDMSPQRRSIEMHEQIAGDYPGAALNKFDIHGIDSLTDSLTYDYSFTAKGAATISGTTAIVPLHFPDRVHPGDFPVEEHRRFPADLTRTDYGIDTQTLTGTLTVPARWRPISLPAPVEISSPFGTYRLRFLGKGNTISFERTAVFKFYRPIDANEFPAVKEFLGKVGKADAVQLVFFTQ
jgi:hypothetical protein